MDFFFFYTNTLDTLMVYFNDLNSGGSKYGLLFNSVLILLFLLVY